MLTLPAWIAASSVSLPLAGALYQWLGLRRDARCFAPPGRMAGIGAGRRLHVRELGSGSPAVILESGIAATCLNWHGVQETLAGFTRVVSYDRGGLGWSDPCATPRTCSNLAGELRTALRAAAVDPPYVLVGHSFGGLVVCCFALLFPEDVAGFWRWASVWRGVAACWRIWV
jgi:pimeloyl-ACP methyl ester carboxylesterase